MSFCLPLRGAKQPVPMPVIGKESQSKSPFGGGFRGRIIINYKMSFCLPLRGGSVATKNPIHTCHSACPFEAVCPDLSGKNPPYVILRSVATKNPENPPYVILRSVATKNPIHTCHSASPYGDERSDKESHTHLSF